MEQLTTSYELGLHKKCSIDDHIASSHKYIVDIENTLSYLYDNKLTIKQQYKDGKVIKCSELETILAFLKNTYDKLNTNVGLINDIINKEYNGDCSKFAFDNKIINNYIAINRANYKEFVKYIRQSHTNIIKDNVTVSTIYTCIASI
jgi:hypothetical protein